MGKIKRGILGGFSGKVANVIGGSWKGIAYMRAMPLSVANPRTAGQVGQRNKLSYLVEVGKLLLVPVIKPLNDRFAQQKSGYNVFIQRNIGFAIDEQTLFSQLIISEGALTTSTVSASIIDPTNLKVSWVNNSGTGSALATDKVFIVALNQGSGEISFNDGGTVRSAGELALGFANNVQAGDTILISMAFLAADGSRASNTVNTTVVL